MQSWFFLKTGKEFWKFYFAFFLFMVKGVLYQNIIKICIIVLEIYPKFPQKTGFSLFLHFQHFLNTLITKKCSHFFHVLKHQKKFRQNWDTPCPETKPSVKLIFSMWTSNLKYVGSYVLKLYMSGQAIAATLLWHL